MATVRSILGALEGAAIERLADGRFAVHGDLPSWCCTLRREGFRWDWPFLLEDAFPFLSTFQQEAEAAWAKDPPVRADTDLWTEVDVNGKEVHLEAAAVRVDSTCLFVITRNDRLFSQNQALLQRARKLRMTHRALTKEIEQKDILVHAIVHDLAAPLHSIMGILSLLEEQGLGEPAAGWIRLGSQAAIRQRDLIVEILDIFAAGDDALGPRVTDGADLCEVLASVVAEREPVARKRNIRLEQRCPSPCLVSADETRLFRVLTNLIDNALRYSPPGGMVRISVRREEASVVVFVEDEGPGVPAAVLPSLFEKFARGTEPGTGTGLGLFYCRITVENYGEAALVTSPARSGARGSGFG